MFITWKDTLAGFVIQLWDSTADTSKFIFGLLWVWTTRQLRFKLVFERRAPRLFIPAEPLKSLGKTGKTLKKTQGNPRKEKKQGPSQKNKERKDREIVRFLNH